MSLKKAPDYYTLKTFDEPIYLLYKNVIYETFKHNEAKHIIKDIETNQLFIMSWALFFNLYMFNNLDQVKEHKQKYNNYFNKGQLKYYFDSEDIYNYNYDETLTLYTPKTKQRKNKHVEHNNILVC
jgi:hypothetical protein